MASRKLFSAATAVTAVSSHDYTADFPEDWCIGSVPHGGYVTACFLQVASKHFTTTLSSQNQPHTIALHLDFLRRTQSGPALFTVKDTKLGRQASIIHITLSQSNREEVVGYLTNSNLHAESGVSFSTNYSLNPNPLPVNLSLLKENRDPNWVREPEMPFPEFRRATQKTQFHFPRLGQKKKSSADEWIRLESGEKWTNASMGYICDTWPMPVEAYIHDENPYTVNRKVTNEIVKLRPATFWYPTLLLNLDVKKVLPDEGVEWLFVRADTKQIKNGRMDIEVVIMDENGEIVALSHHVALAVGLERNIAQRRKEASKI